MFIFVLFITLALLAWLIIKPGWLPAPPENAYQERFSLQFDRLKQKSGVWFRQVKPFWKKKDSLGLQLKTWASNEELTAWQQSEELTELRGWIVSLTDAEAGALAQELSNFCWKQGVNIIWLLEDSGSLEMQTALTSLVRHYCLAVRERISSRPAACLRAWSAAPLAKENRRFGNLLYIGLVEAGLIRIPPALLLAPEKQRLEHQISAIKSLLEKDPEGLLPYAEQAIETRKAQTLEKVFRSPLPSR
jgi:hypothetical protein